MREEAQLRCFNCNCPDHSQPEIQSWSLTTVKVRIICDNCGGQTIIIYEGQGIEYRDNNDEECFV